MTPETILVYKPCLYLKPPTPPPQRHLSATEGLAQITLEFHVQPTEPLFAFWPEDKMSHKLKS